MSPSDDAESFFSKARRVFATAEVGSFLAAKVTYSLVVRAAGSMHSQWEMERFGLDVSKLGYLTTAKCAGDENIATTLPCLLPYLASLLSPKRDHYPLRRAITPLFSPSRYHYPSPNGWIATPSICL